MWLSYSAKQIQARQAQDDRSIPRVEKLTHHSPGLAVGKLAAGRLASVEPVAVELAAIEFADVEPAVEPAAVGSFAVRAALFSDG